MKTKTTFWELMEGELMKKGICVPIIQRDYAQGRTDEKEVRDSFLDSLIEVLKVDEKSLCLDFVYGTERSDGSVCVIDGQQRLTTLFLLYWFISWKEEGKLEERKGILGKFTYETRVSSREFCAALVEKGATIISKEGEISDAIRNCSWFFRKWEQDPTVRGMLVMLDAIQEKSAKLDVQQWWSRIEKGINFHYLSLNDFGLDDDLYIKMNSRGKQLSPWENFKAGMGRESKSNWDEEFYKRIDNEWTDFFWKLAVDQKDKEDSQKAILPDPLFTRFFAESAITRYALTDSIYENKDEEEKLLKEKALSKEAITLRRIEERMMLLNERSDSVRPKDFIAKMDFEEKLLNKYAEGGGVSSAFIKPVDIPFFWDTKEDETSLFQRVVLSQRPTYGQRVLFYAQNRYLVDSDSDVSVIQQDEKFKDWIRVIRNIVENTTVDSAATFRGAIKLVDEIFTSMKMDIYSFLGADNVHLKSGFGKIQVEHEREKAKLIMRYSKYKKSIHTAEDCYFCKGNLSFAFACLDELKWSASETEEHDFSKLELLIQFFEKYLFEEKLSDEFRRAFLTIKDGNGEYYLNCKGWSHRLSCNKYSLLENTIDLKNNFTQPNRNQQLVKLICKIFEKGDIGLKRVIDECIDENPSDMPKWRRMLIKNEALLREHCSKKYLFGLLIEDESQLCYLFDGMSRPKKDQCYPVTDVNTNN